MNFLRFVTGSFRIITRGRMSYYAWVIFLILLIIWGGFGYANQLTQRPDSNSYARFCFMGILYREFHLSGRSCSCICNAGYSGIYLSLETNQGNCDFRRIISYLRCNNVSLFYYC